MVIIYEVCGLYWLYTIIKLYINIYIYAYMLIQHYKSFQKLIIMHDNLFKTLRHLHYDFNIVRLLHIFTVHLYGIVIYSFM